MELFWDSSNWQGLCAKCHGIKTASEDGGFGNRGTVTPAWMPRPSKPLIVVCGRPRAGKSTWIANNQQDGDLVVCVDEIRTDLAGDKQGSAAWGAVPMGTYLRERNRRLAEFCNGLTEHKRCLLIATCGQYRQRKYWQDLGAEVIVLDTPLDVCLMRIEADDEAGEEERRVKAEAARAWR